MSRLTWVRAALTHPYRCVNGIVFVCPDNGMAASVCEKRKGEKRVRNFLLNLSLPHLKTASKSVKFDVFKSFCLPFGIGMKGFPSLRTIQKTDLLQDQKIYCFAGLCGHFSAQKLYSL